MEKVLVGFGTNWKGVGLQHTRGLFGPLVNRWSIKRSPNDTKLTGGLPVVNQGRLASLGPIRKCLTPTHERKVEMTTGGERSAEMQNGQRGKCSNA